MWEAPPPSWLIRSRVSLSSLPTSATRSPSKGRGVSGAPIRKANSADWCSDCTLHGCDSMTVYEYARGTAPHLRYQACSESGRQPLPCLVLRLRWPGFHPPARHPQLHLWCQASARAAHRPCAAQLGAACPQDPARPSEDIFMPHCCQVKERTQWPHFRLNTSEHPQAAAQTLA